jgi:hypothetical protein
MEEISETATNLFCTKNMMIAGAVIVALLAIYYFYFRSAKKVNVPEDMQIQMPEEEEQMQ